MGQFVAGVKEKVNGDQGHNDVPEETPGALTVPEESRAPSVAAHSDPPTDGHAPTDVDRPRVMDIILDMIKAIAEVRAEVAEARDPMTRRMPPYLRPRL